MRSGNAPVEDCIRLGELDLQGALIDNRNAGDLFGRLFAHGGEAFNVADILGDAPVP